MPVDVERQTLTIRQATAQDLGTICQLIRELADYEHLAHEVAFDDAVVGHHLFGPEPVAHVLLALPDPSEAGGPEPCGFALWYRTFSTFVGRPGIWLEDLYVRPEHRGRGHALALLQRLRELTDGRVEWAVLDWNREAIGFYDHLGASPVEGWTRYRWLPTAARPSGG